MLKGQPVSHDIILQNNKDISANPSHLSGRRCDFLCCNGVGFWCGQLGTRVWGTDCISEALQKHPDAMDPNHLDSYQGISVLEYPDTRSEILGLVMQVIDLCALAVCTSYYYAAWTAAVEGFPMSLSTVGLRWSSIHHGHPMSGSHKRPGRL